MQTPRRLAVWNGLPVATTTDRGMIVAERASSWVGWAVRAGVVAVMAAAWGVVLPAREEPGKADPGSSRRARFDALAAWSRAHSLDGWPLSNSGDPDLQGVVFLYDLAITAQAQLAAGQPRAAHDLLRRVAREWPRFHGGLVDSLDVARRQPFDRFNGVPRVTNGPNMLLALSAITVWAAGNHADDELRRLAQEIADLVRRQATTVGSGAIPYGPGDQRFPDGTPFRVVFNPEYQLDAYALFHRMGDITDERGWEAAAVRAIDWLVANRYDRKTKRFWARNDRQAIDDPPDVPGWAMSMVAPNLLAAKGVDVPALIADLGREPTGVIPTEWLVNRRNGLKRGADYLSAIDKRGADEARARVVALDAVLLGLPLQPVEKGGGLAYAYRRKPGGPGWEPAEGVPTGWGWNTQRGASRVAGDYLLASLAYAHDPVAGSLNGRTIRWRPAPAAEPAPPPAAAALPVLPAEAQAVQIPGDASSYRLRIARRNYEQSRLRVIISRMLRDATPGAHDPPGTPPVISIQPRGRGESLSLNGFDRFEDHVASHGLGAGPKGAGRLAAIGLRNRLEEQWFVVTRQANVTASNGHRVSPSVGSYRFILIDPSRDFEVAQGFFHLTAREQARDLQKTVAGPLRDQYDRTPSYEEWARTRPGVIPVLPPFNRANGFYHKVTPDGLILARTALFVTVHPETGELTGAWWKTPKEAKDLVLAYKRPISRQKFERFQADHRLPSITGRFGVEDDHNGGYFEWTKKFSFERELAVDIRVVKRVGPPFIPGDRVILAPSQLGIMSQGVLLNPYLSTQGYFDGMVLGPRPNDPGASPIDPGARPPGWVYLRPSFIGKRTRDWEFLRSVEALRRETDDDETRRRLDRAFDEGERILNWLADLEAHLRRRLGQGAMPDGTRLLEQIEQARSNIWKDPQGDYRLIVGRTACKAADVKLHELDQLITPNPGAVPGLVNARRDLAKAIDKARELGFDEEEPTLSRYEEVLRDYRAHLNRLKSQVRELRRLDFETPDETRRDTLKRAEASLRDDVRTMSFRVRDRNEAFYYALIPGHREVAATLALVEAADGLPAAKRVARAAGARGPEVSDPLALTEFGSVLVPRSREQQHLRYRSLYTDPAGHTLVEVSSDRNWLHRYEVYESTGELVGKFQGRIRVDERPARVGVKLGPSARVQADFFAYVRPNERGAPPGEDLVPLARHGPIPAEELTAQALRAAWAGARPNAARGEQPLFRTELDNLNGTVVKLKTRHDGATYHDFFHQRTPSEPEVQLDRRVYDEKDRAMEIYHDYRPNSVTAGWLPARIEVWFQDQRTEYRVLQGVDDRGRASYRVNTLGVVPSPLLAAVPVAIRPLLPSWVRAKPGVAVERVDTREPDGLLYCRDLRGPGAINERTYYDVDRERAVFASTGQNVDIPLHTYHAADDYTVAPQPVGRPFVYYKVVHNDPSDGVVDHLASYEVNVESTYDVGRHELLANAISAASLGSGAAAGLCAEYAREAAPQPGEVKDLVASLGLREPFWRRFRWGRRLHLLGPAGQHNQRLMSVSELSEVEVETESSLVQYLHEPKGNGPGLVGGRETVRRFVPKTPDGRFYVTRRGRVEVSDPSTRRVPSGYLERRIPEPDSSGAGAGLLADIVWVCEGEARERLDPEGLLPVTIRNSGAQVMRVVYEDAFERAAVVAEFLVKSPPGAERQGHVVQVVDPGAWYWHPGRRQWYPKAIARYTDGILDERRELLYVAGMPRIDSLDGRATYHVQPYYRGDGPSPGLVPSGRLVDILADLELLVPDVHRIRWVAGALGTLKATAALRPVEPYEVVIEPDGSIVERRDHLVTVMDVTAVRDFLARSGYECLMPAAAYERLPAGGRGELIARFTSELRSEGRLLTVTRASTLANDWAESVYERDPMGVHDPFGRWAHWRLVREVTGSRPGVPAFRTFVFYRGDAEKRSDLLPDAKAEIDGFLKREDQVRRGRGYRPPDAGEIGRVIFDAGAPGDKTPVLYQYVLGVAPNVRPGWSAPFVCRTLHDWPGAEPLERLTDHRGRPVGETLSGPVEGFREVAEGDVVFDRSRLVWSVRRSRVIEAKPPGYISVDPARHLPSVRLVNSQESVSLGWTPADEFYPDSPGPDRLERVREAPTPFVGHAASQTSESYYDELGRPWLETHTTRSGGTTIEWLTYYPQGTSLEFQRAATGGVLAFRTAERTAQAFDRCDFLLFYARGRDADSARVHCRSERRDLGELPRLNAWGRGCWSADFDDPIVLESPAGSEAWFRVIAVRPLRGKAPLLPIGDRPRAVIVPVAWLRTRGIDPSTVELELVDESGGTAQVEVTPVQRLRSSSGSRAWRPSDRGQASLFPVGPAGDRIVEREPRVIELGNDVVAVFRGRGPGSKALVYDQGRLVAATMYHRNGRDYDHVRVRFADAATPYLRTPLYYEAVSNGWLGRLVQPVEYPGGRALLMVANVNQPLAASLFPYGGGRAYGAGIVRSGNNPVTVYPPLGWYDSESPFPGLGAGLVNALVRYGSVREPDQFRLIGPTLAVPARELLDPHNVRALVQESPLDLPSGWPWRPTPVAVPSPAGAAFLPLPELQAWADDFEAMIEGRRVLPLLETHPGTPRAGFAETHDVAALVAGLVAAARAAQDPARRRGRLAAATRVVGFYRSATSDGARPALSAYRVSTGARLAFSDEWRLPAIAMPTARANVALARAALELARATGDPETWQFVCRLTARVLDFVPDADPLWPRDAADQPDARHRPESLAARLLTAWRRGAQSPRRLDADGVGSRAREALASGKLSQPFQELLRVVVATGPSHDRKSFQTGKELVRNLIAQSFRRGREVLGREVAEAGHAAAKTVPGADARSDVARVLVVALGETDDDRDRLLHWFRACGGLCEHPPRQAVGLPTAGLTLSPETDRYELPTNADALALLTAMEEALETGPSRDREEQVLYSDIVVARTRLVDWFRFLILPVVARGGGHAPSHWRQQRWITGIVPTGVDGAEEPHVIVPNRWTTLESSLAAARAALMVAPGDTARVRAWLANLLKVYGSAAPGGSRTMSGMSFAPETFARYEGPLYSAALTLEYAALSRRVSYEPGRAFAEASLPTFLALDASGGHVQVRAAAGPGPFPPGEGVETGDGRTLYTEAGGEGVFGWSPVATLLAAGARAEAESKAQAKPMAVDSADRLALCRIATQKGSAPGWLSPSASPREQMVRFIGLLAALLAVAALGLVVPRLDLGRRRRRDASDSRQPARDHLSTGMDRQWGRGRFPVQVVPKIGRG